jgi:hypothetical protein
MTKKKKTEIETLLRSAQPEEVAEWSQQLAGLIEERKAIKRRAKESARTFKQQLEANEEEQERLSRMIITRQEEVPLKRQMTLAEIEDQRRHELSIEEFQRESGETLLRKDEQTPEPIADSGDVVEAATRDDDEEELPEGERRWPYPEIRVSREFIEDNGPMDKSSSVMQIEEGKLRKPFEYEEKLWVELGSVSQHLRTLSRDCYVVVRREDYEGPEPMFYRDVSERGVGYVGIKGVHKKQVYVIVDGPFTFLPDDAEESTMTSPEMASSQKLLPNTIRDLDSVPHDPQKRKWSELSDEELITWSRELGNMKGETAKEWLKRVNSEQQIRAGAPESDPLDLVPDDKHGRTWRDLSDVELVQWRDRLTRMIDTAKHDGETDEQSELRFKRVRAEIARRDEAWSKADSATAD